MALLQLDRRLFFEPWSERAFRDALGNGRYYAQGAWGAQQLVGYLIGAVVADEAELLQIGVAPEQRRRGIAAALLGDYLAWLRAREVVALHLEVRESATAAQAFYRRAGFDAVGRRRGYYPSEAGREDGLLFTWRR